MKKFVNLKTIIIAIAVAIASYFGYNLTIGSGKSTANDSTAVNIDSVAVAPADSTVADTAKVAVVDTTKK